MLYHLAVAVVGMTLLLLVWVGSAELARRRRYDGDDPADCAPEGIKCAGCALAGRCGPRSQ